MKTWIRTTMTATMILFLGSGTFTQVARPDLKINTMYLAKWEQPPVTAYQPISGSIVSGTKVFLVCDVTNGGNAKITGNYLVSFRIDGAEIGAHRIENSPDPQLLTKPGVAWTASKIGTHTFQCILDPEGHITELDERNNQQSKTFGVRLKATSFPKLEP